MKAIAVILLVIVGKFLHDFLNKEIISDWWLILLAVIAIVITIAVI